MAKMEPIDAMQLYFAAQILQKYNRDEDLAERLYEITKETINLDPIINAHPPGPGSFGGLQES